MASIDIKKAIERYFHDNWDSVAVPIQYEGTEFNYSGQNDWISLVYNPVETTRYGFDGTNNGRLRYVGIQKVFCYAENPTKAYQIAKDVGEFLNGVELGNVVIDIGQDRTAIDLENDYFEVMVLFNLSEFA